jgi:hypothetical protein
MSTITLNRRVLSSRAYRPHEFRPDHDTPCCEAAMDVAHENGLSQLERGSLVNLDPRTANAMRVSLESALRDIAARFGLKAAVTQAVPHADRADFVVVLKLQPRS